MPRWVQRIRGGRWRGRITPPVRCWEDNNASGNEDQRLANLILVLYSTGVRDIIVKEDESGEYKYVVLLRANAQVNEAYHGPNSPMQIEIVLQRFFEGDDSPERTVLAVVTKDGFRATASTLQWNLEQEAVKTEIDLCSLKAETLRQEISASLKSKWREQQTTLP